MAGGSTDLFVPEVVERFLDAHGIGEGPVSYRPLGDGHSNLTYLVERGGTRVVLRRPPRPPCRPRRTTCCASRRSSRALHAAGARVPACSRSATTSAARRPVLRHGAAPGVPIDRRAAARHRHARGPRAAGEEFVDALAEIHAIDPEAAGLATFGRPDGYLERQIGRFLKIWPHNAHARPARGRGAWRVAARASAAAGAGDRRPRRLPGRATCSSPRTRPRASARCSTGSCRRSATRSPTSATCCRCTPTTRSRRPGYPPLSPVTAELGFPSRAELARAVRGAHRPRHVAHRLVRVPRALEGRRVPREHVEALPGGRPGRRVRAGHGAGRAGQAGSGRGRRGARRAPGLSGRTRPCPDSRRFSRGRAVRRSARSSRARRGSGTGWWSRRRCSRRLSRGRRSTRRSARRSS